MSHRRHSVTRLWVANLKEHCTSQEIIHLFEKYGPVHNIVRKGHFSTIEFENSSDALKAKHGMDGADFEGRRLSVNWYSGDPNLKMDSRNWWNGKRGHSRNNSKYTCIVLGLPSNISHQQILNIAWEAGNSVVYVDKKRNEYFMYGVIEYSYFDDYKYAVDYLDGKKYSDCILRFVNINELSNVCKHRRLHYSRSGSGSGGDGHHYHHQSRSRMKNDSRLNSDQNEKLFQMQIDRNSSMSDSFMRQNSMNVGSNVMVQHPQRHVPVVQSQGMNNNRMFGPPNNFNMQSNVPFNMNRNSVDNSGRGGVIDNPY